MKQLFWSSVIISNLFWFSACSSKQVKSVLDDISRDTYENSMREQRLKNRDDPSYEVPPTYDQYQQRRKETLEKTRDASRDVPSNWK